MRILYVQDMSILYIRQYVHITWRMKKRIYIAQRGRLVSLLREMRIEAGLTQTDLAASIEKDQTFVSRYESGQRRLDVLEVREICQAIGITLEEFARRLEKALK
jgi:ribosome-binding protein aMBF1 (putative translation factor)